LGDKAPFPLGPFTLASILGAPVYLVLALYHDPNRYDLYCEPFSESLRVSRKGRDAFLAIQVQRYAHRLEHFCRLAPDNWFNFYDFWREN